MWYVPGSSMICMPGRLRDWVHSPVDLKMYCRSAADGRGGGVENCVEGRVEDEASDVQDGKEEAMSMIGGEERVEADCSIKRETEDGTKEGRVSARLGSASLSSASYPTRPTLLSQQLTISQSVSSGPRVTYGICERL